MPPTTASTTPTQLNRYRLFGGTHRCKDAKGNPQQFKHGDIVESPLRLDLIFGADRFQPITQYTPEPIAQQRPPTSNSLDKMSEEDLRKLAADEEIDVRHIGKGQKSELIKFLKENL